jgi:hypothetical protein
MKWLTHILERRRAARQAELDATTRLDRLKKESADLRQQIEAVTAASLQILTLLTEVKGIPTHRSKGN